MDEQEDKLPPFTVVAIVCMLLITIPSDITTTLTAFNFIAAIPFVGVVILAIDKVLSVIAWAIIQFWFFMALGTFGKSGLVVLVGGALDVLGVPATTTITTMTAVWLANHPTAGGAVRALAEKAADKAAVAKGGKGGASAVGKGETAAKSKAVVGAGTKETIEIQTAQGAQPGGATGHPSAESGEEARVGARPSEIETGVKPSENKEAPPTEEGEKKQSVSERQLGAAPGPFEQAQEETGLTGELPEPESDEEEEAQSNGQNKAA